MAIQANLLMTVVVIQSDRPHTLRSTPTQPSQQIFFLRGAKFGEASPRFQALSEWPTAEVIRAPSNGANEQVARQYTRMKNDFPDQRAGRRLRYILDRSSGGDGIPAC